MESMKARTETNGGTTLHLMSGEYDRYTDGYYVGGLVKGETFPLAGSYAADYTIAAINIISRIPVGAGETHIGSWLDRETGTVWIDASEHYADRTEALRVAVDRGELAIWDIAANEEVRVP